MTLFCLNNTKGNIILNLEGNMNLKQSLGLKIKELRKKKGISQEKFSEMIDMNPRQVVRIENGESFPTAENLEKIACALNINPQELFHNDYIATNEVLKQQITTSLDNLSNKELRIIYLLIKNF